MAAQGRRVGIGLACYVEGTGVGPYEGAHVHIETSGKVKVATGLTTQGQGHQTAFAQIVADTLGVRFEDVEITTGDTRKMPYAVGTFASRAAVMSGSAIHLASCGPEKALRIAAEALEASRTTSRSRRRRDGAGRPARRTCSRTPRRRTSSRCSRWRSSHVAHPTIRNRGTTVGSLVHADAAAEMPMVLRLLEGSVDVASVRGRRTVPAAELFAGPLESTARATTRSPSRRSSRPCRPAPASPSRRSPAATATTPWSVSRRWWRPRAGRWSGRGSASCR